MHHRLRGLAVLILLVVLEIIRQSTHVHALVYDDFTRAGLTNVPSSIFDISSEFLPAWNLWLATLAICIVCISSLCLRAFGRSLQAVLYSGTISWLALFVSSWLAFMAFGMGSVQTMVIALVGAWVESILLSFVVVFWLWQGAPSPSSKQA